MIFRLLAAAALVMVSMPALAADAYIPHPRYVQQGYGDPLIIDFSHNYGPADFYPGTLAPPDRVIVPLIDRPYGIYDGFGPLCAQSTAYYIGQDRRRHPCN